MAGTQQQQMDPKQLNAIAGQLIRSNAVEMKQQIYANTFDPRTNNVLNIIPRNVGLIKYFLVEITATLPNASGSTWSRTNFGPANLLSQVVFNDLNNNVRINDAGWHIELIDSVKDRRVYGSALVQGTGMDTPIGYGSNYNVISTQSPAGTVSSTIVDGATGIVKMVYKIPMAYSDNDYRGAIYANVVNATMNLQLTINNAFVTATGVDSTLAGYSSAGTASQITSCTVVVTQVFMDQIPQGKAGPILPILDLSTIYELKNTTFSNITQNQDFPMQYSNFRDFLSTSCIYFNGTALVAGTDITYWALRSANFTNIFQIDPTLAALFTRQIIGADVPVGCTYFSSRQKPIATTQYGNMELVLNASTAGAGAYILQGVEDFAIVNTLTQAGSLAGA